MYSVLNTLLENTYFYISKIITSCTFCLFLKSVEAFSVSLITKLLTAKLVETWRRVFKFAVLKTEETSSEKQFKHKVGGKGKKIFQKFGVKSQISRQATPQWTQNVTA